MGVLVGLGGSGGFGVQGFRLLGLWLAFGLWGFVG